MFVAIQPGQFMMGSRDGERNERPPHQVTLTRAFELQKTETTQAEWRAVMGSNPSHFRGDDKPVESVSWNDVQTFIARLNARSDGYRYRLPTEAEWEYAARAGAVLETSAEAGKLGFHAGNSGLETRAVRSMPPNAWGLFDMRGNVWEWVSDWYRDYGPAALVDPVGGSKGTLRVMRGGGWHSTADALRATFRLGAPPEFRNSALGLRLARELR